MKRFLYVICFLCPILFFGKDPGPIHEVNSFEELPALLSHQNEARTVVFLDLDDLILFPMSSVGRLTWLNEMKSLLSENGVSEEIIDEVRFSVWEYALLHTSFSLARESSKDVLRQLQFRGLPILGVSRRSFTSSRYLPAQLQKLGIDLVSSLPAYLRFSLFLSGHAPKAMLTQGILFTGSLPLSSAFDRLLESVSIPLHSIVCISSDIFFLQSCLSFFNSKKTKGVYLLLPLKEKENLRLEEAKFQLFSVRSILEDDLVNQIRDVTQTLSNRDVVHKIKDIWEMCSG